MTILDILLILIVIAGIVLGYRRGILAQCASLLGVILGIIMCRVFAGPLADSFISPADTEHTRVTTTILCYVLIFMACYIAMRMLSGTIRSIVSTLHLGVFDNIGGAVFKSLEWLLALSLLLNVLQAVLPDTHIHSSRPALDRFVYDFGPKVIGSGVVQDAYDKAGELEDALREHAPARTDSTSVSDHLINGAAGHVLR